VVLIATYHAIASPASPVCCPASQFEADLSALLDAGVTFVSLDDCADWLCGLRTLNSRSMVLTFDDGYASVVTRALPVLIRFGLPAVVYVIGRRIGGDNRWPGQWPSIPTMPLADIAQLKELAAAGIEIGSHSWSHPVLTEIDNQSLTAEVNHSADRLEQALGIPIRHFAYPYGIRGSREITAARQRFRTAVNAEARLVAKNANPHDLHRVDCHDLAVALRARLLDPITLRPYLTVRRRLRTLRRTMERMAGSS
jgi:peptidoglycan/xylan/chitin deacetylase (PgdA/CDA1 family)